MFIIDFINKAKGLVKISIEGFFIEKFINICTYKNIKLNNLKRLNGCVLEAEVNIQDFKRLHQICRKTKCRLKILDKEGIPFLLHRYRKRKLFIVALILIIMLVVYANCLIWKIDINCDDEVIENQIWQQLEQLNIKKYKFKGNMDLEDIKNELMINIQEITWIEMEFKGVLLSINVKIGNLPPEVIDENEYCNVVASKSGLIQKVIVKNGLKVIEPGQIVEKGDLLITGIITSEVVDDWMVHADGEVYAKVWYNKTIEVPFEQNNIIYTGNKDVYYGINLINKKVFLKKVSTNYEEYDTILQEKDIEVLNIKLPIKCLELIYYEKQTLDIQRTEAEALEYGVSILDSMLLEVIAPDSKVIDKITNTIVKDKSIYIERIYECLEQIGTKEKISLLEGEE